MLTTLKRLFWLAVLGGAGFAVWSMIQRKNAPTTPSGPEWPPIDTSDPAAPAESAPAAFAAVTVDDAAAGASASTESSESAESGARWVEPVDGACPISHPIKANDNSGIFHVPGGRFYERTGAERCYARAEDATADGYRAAKS